MRRRTEGAAAASEWARYATVIGLAVTVLGILAILAPMVTGLAVGTVVASLLIAAGIGQTYFAFRSKTFGEGAFRLLFGGVGIIAGIVMIARPALGLGAMSLVAGAYLCVEGVMRILLGIQVKRAPGPDPQGWGWIVWSGVAALLLGGMILYGWPVSGRWAVGILVGVHLLFEGWGLVMLGGVGQAVAEDLAAEGDD